MLHRSIVLVVVRFVGNSCLVFLCCLILLYKKNCPLTLQRGQFVKWLSRRFDLKSMFLWGRLPVPDSGWDLPLEKGITLALFQHYLNQVCPVRELVGTYNNWTFNAVMLPLSRCTPKVKRDSPLEVRAYRHTSICGVALLTMHLFLTTQKSLSDFHSQW